MMRARIYLASAAALLLAVYIFVNKGRLAPPVDQAFDGQNALSHVEYQLELGPRLAGSDAHSRAVTYFTSSLEKSAWEVSVQETVFQGQNVRNVIAIRGSGTPWTIVAAHYDSRQVADQDPQAAQRSQPVPGANDGASGAAVLLELGESLPREIQGQIWLVFFDAEDNGGINGWDWILGSRAFVSLLEGKPDAAVILDMIGDKDLNIFYENNSNEAISQELWAEAARAGYGEQFIQRFKHSMLDDHTPFLQAGIPAVDIIDFDYPYWHTTADTLDKVSAASLEAVGITVENWLESRHSK